MSGAGVSYGYTKQRYSPDFSGDRYVIKTHLIGANMFAQRFFTLSEKFFFTVKTNGSLGYYIIDENHNEPVGFMDNKSKAYSVSAGVSPGLSYRISTRLLFNASLSDLLYASFTHTNRKTTNGGSAQDRSSNNFVFNSSLSNTSLGNIGLGFYYLLKLRFDRIAQFH